MQGAWQVMHSREEDMRRAVTLILSLNFFSLRGRRLKGKGKGVLAARETRGAREEGVSLAPKTPFPQTPFSLPFQNAGHAG